MDLTVLVHNMLPELVLSFGVIFMLLYGAFSHMAIKHYLGISILFLSFALIGIFLTNSEYAIIFDGAFVNDSFARFIKILILVGSICSLTLAKNFLLKDNLNKFEFPVLILIATLGMMLMVSANNLLSLYLSLELASLSLYVIVAFNRDNILAGEAGVKYFTLGALSSGMFLYGCSLIYGLTGSLDFYEIMNSLDNNSILILTLALVFLFAGFAFKISAAPFHMWTPDVYQGSPTVITAFLASSPKIAAMAIIIRIVIVAFGNVIFEWQQIIIFIALASMIIGSFAAIGQKNIKRLIAYSSIGHIGFALVGVASGSNLGIRGTIIYMTIYLIMVIGTFAAILIIQKNGKAIEQIHEFAGLNKCNKLSAFLLSCLMFSLAGIPLFAGFFAKWYVFIAAVKANLYWLVIIGLLLSVVSCFYYLRIVKFIYFDEPDSGFDKVNNYPAKVILFSAGIIVLTFVFYPYPLEYIALLASSSLF